MPFARIIALCVALLTLPHCISASELEERKKDAFELAGTWKIIGSTKSLAILDEADRTDVKGTLTRSGLSDAELTLFAAHDVDVTAATNNFGTVLVLGAGAGLDNWSADNGATSTLAISSPAVDFGKSVAVHYTLSATVTKSDLLMRATLTAHLSYPKTTYVDGKPVVTTELDSAQAQSFTATNGTVQAQQYFGVWTGEVTPTGTAAPPTLLSALEIVAVTGGYQLIPTPKVVTLAGKTYTAEILTSPLSDLEASLPSLSVRYMGSVNDHLLLIGNIYSLGEFDGSLLQLNANGDATLAGFRLGRN